MNKFNILESDINTQFFFVSFTTVCLAVYPTSMCPVGKLVLNLTRSVILPRSLKEKLSLRVG